MSNPFHVPARDASVAQIRAAYETAFGRPPAAGDDEIADCVAELVRDAEAEGASAPTVNDADHRRSRARRRRAGNGHDLDHRGGAQRHGGTPG